LLDIDRRIGITKIKRGGRTLKRVTKNNLMKLIKMKKQYIETGNKELLNEINDYIDNVINRDKHYFSKIHKYKFSREELRFLIF